MLDPEAVDALASEADVARAPRVHHPGRPRGDPRGSTSRARATSSRPRGARVKRLVYTSSVAAYGFHADNPQPLTEDVRRAAATRFYYSAQKAELERVLARCSPAERGLRPAPVHRRRARTRRCSLRQTPARPPRRRCRAAARPRHAVPARPPRRRRRRAGRRDLGAGPARRLQPRRRRDDHARRPRPRARLARVPGPARLRRRPRRRSAPACRSCPRSRSGSTPAASPVVMDTAQARRELGWGRATTRPRDAGRDRRGRALAWDRLTECVRMGRTQSFGTRRAR